VYNFPQTKPNLIRSIKFSLAPQAKKNRKKLEIQKKNTKTINASKRKLFVASKVAKKTTNNKLKRKE